MPSDRELQQEIEDYCHHNPSEREHIFRPTRGRLPRTSVIYARYRRMREGRTRRARSGRKPRKKKMYKQRRHSGRYYRSTKNVWDDWF